MLKDGKIAARLPAQDLQRARTFYADKLGLHPVRFEMLLDGQPPGDAHGLDVDESGAGTVSEPRMYQLVRQQGLSAQRTFEITFRDPGLRGYVFTFG